MVVIYSFFCIVMLLVSTFVMIISFPFTQDVLNACFLISMRIDQLVNCVMESHKHKVNFELLSGFV